MNIEDVKRYSELHFIKVKEFEIVAKEFEKITNNKFKIVDTVKQNIIQIKRFIDIDEYKDIATKIYHLLYEIEDIESNKIDEEILLISKHVPEITKIKTVSREEYNELYNSIRKQVDNIALAIIIDEIFDYYKNGDKIIIK